MRLRPGYNPNSSSVGSLVPIFLGGALGGGLLAAIGAQALILLRRPGRIEPHPPGSDSGQEGSLRPGPAPGAEPDEPPR